MSNDSRDTNAEKNNFIASLLKLTALIAGIVILGCAISKAFDYLL
jgi:hypothetical protein